MERIEDLLREEFGRGAEAVPVPREVMLARVVGARRRRTLATAAVGAVATAGLLASAVALSAAGLPGRSASQAAAPMPQPVYDLQLVNVIFTDRDHGYALQQVCESLLPAEGLPTAGPTPDLHTECHTQFIATADAGTTWQERALPAEPAMKDVGIHLQSGHSLMFSVAKPGTLALGAWDRVYWTTTDAGRTWQKSVTPLPTGPAGSFGTFTRDDRLTFLATAPPRVTDKNPLVAAKDGSFWLTCGGEACVRVTHDHGKTWQALAIRAGASTVTWVATADGHTVYAGGRDGTRSLLLRSVDAGGTWVVLPAAGLPQLTGSGLALDNGDLIVTAATTDGGIYRLAAGATAAVRLTTAPAHASALYRTGGVIVAAQVRDERGDPTFAPVVSVSPDNGTTWRTVLAPA